MTAAETLGGSDVSLGTAVGNQNNHHQTIQQVSSDPEEPIELKENFYITHSNKRKHNLKVEVYLNGDGIYFRRESPDDDQITEQLIPIEDIVGSYCGSKLKKRSRGGLNYCKRSSVNEEQHHNEDSIAEHNHEDVSAYLYIYAYLKKEKPLRRIRTVRVLRFRSFAEYEENLKSAERWNDAIRFNKLLEKHLTVERKPLLILLNPKSGKCKGRVMFQKQMAPILKEAEVQYDLVITTHANFARDLIKQRTDLVQKYSGIIVASGDGLLFEVINGMLERPDWRSLARHLPIGIVPCGSGNGLASSIAYLYNEPYDPKSIVNSALTCISGQSSPLDVVRVELKAQGNITEMYSFHSIGWGLIADIDIESEKLRSIGAPRFTLWSIHRILNLRTYKGKISYLPWRKKGSPYTEEEVMQNFKSISILRRFHDAVDDDSQEFSDTLEDDDISGEFADIISKSSYKTNMDSWHSAVSRRTAYYSLAGRSTTTGVENKSEEEEANAELDTQAPKTTIPAINMPLTDEWYTEEGDFVMAHAAYTTHLSADCLFAPDSKLNDGIIYLVLIRAGIGRHQLLRFLKNMSSGTRLFECPTTHLEIIPVTAFRIEPQDTGGIITVDGERVDYGAIQAEMLPGLINVMVPNSPQTQFEETKL